MRRWSDFERVNSPSAEEIEQAQERIDAGESAMEALSELLAHDRALARAVAMRTMKHGLGLSAGAQSAFWAKLPEHLQGTERLRLEDALDHAAQLGLVVGLTAQQLAEETPGES